MLPSTIYNLHSTVGLYGLYLPHLQSTVYLPAVSGGGGRNLRILKTIQCQTREIKWLPWIEV